MRSYTLPTGRCGSRSLQSEMRVISASGRTMTIVSFTSVCMAERYPTEQEVKHGS